MRSLSTFGLDEMIANFDKAEAAAQGIAKTALYEGAAVVADAIHASLDSIQTEPFHFVPEGGEKRLPSPEEKAAAKAAKFGVAKHRASGAEVDTVVGISGSGYVHLMGKQVPAAVVLRSIQSGTSFMKAQPVVRKAINRAKGAAAAKIAAEGEARIQKLFKQ